MTAQAPGCLDQAPAWTDAWLDALDELELAVDRAEALLRSAEPDMPEISPWAPPAGLGPLPLGLLDRARVLHARQLRVSKAIAESLASTRAQRAVAARLVTSAPQPTAMYVDQAY